VQIATRVPLSLYLGPRLVNAVSLRKRPNSLYLQNKLSPYPDALQHLFPLPPVLRQLLPLRHLQLTQQYLFSTSRACLPFSAPKRRAKSMRFSFSYHFPPWRPRAFFRGACTAGCDIHTVGHYTNAMNTRRARTRTKHEEQELHDSRLKNKAKEGRKERRTTAAAAAALSTHHLSGLRF
jgi:hypothetical protein